MRSKFAAALLALCLVAACSGGKQSAKGTPTPSPSPSPTATVSPTPDPQIDLLTGTSPAGKASLVAIKVDNAPLARPYQVGMDRAAIVYQEIVEGGLTRFLAIFESDLAGSHEVGPIRSARQSDVEILRGFGKIPVAFSGAQPSVKAIFHAAQKRGWLVDDSYDVLPGAYRLGERRKDARNFYAVPSRLTAARGGNGPVDVGFRFGPPVGGIPTPRLTASFSPETRVGLVYNAATSSYSVRQNGSVLRAVAPANIIIQSVKITGSGFKDVHGFTTPRTVSTGGGAVTILRDGKRYAGKWVRKGFGATRFLDARGKDLPLSPGRTWVLLLPTTGHVTYS